jgi:hypothetical protein
VVYIKVVISNPYRKEVSEVNGITVKYKDLTVEISWMVIALVVLTLTTHPF